MTGSSFEFFLEAGRPVRIKVQLAADEADQSVAVRTGWATFAAPDEIEVVASVRVMSPDGGILSRHIVSGEIPPAI
jgi:hypothetical protein